MFLFNGVKGNLIITSNEFNYYFYFNKTSKHNKKIRLMHDRGKKFYKAKGYIQLIKLLIID